MSKESTQINQTYSPTTESQGLSNMAIAGIIAIVIIFVLGLFNLNQIKSGKSLILRQLNPFLVIVDIISVVLAFVGVAYGGAMLMKR